MFRRQGDDPLHRRLGVLAGGGQQLPALGQQVLLARGQGTLLTDRIQTGAEGIERPSDGDLSRRQAGKAGEGGGDQGGEFDPVPRLRQGRPHPELGFSAGGEHGARLAAGVGRPCGRGETAIPLLDGPAHLLASDGPRRARDEHHERLQGLAGTGQLAIARDHGDQALGRIDNRHARRGIARKLSGVGGKEGRAGRAGQDHDLAAFDEVIRGGPNRDNRLAFGQAETITSRTGNDLDVEGIFPALNLIILVKNRRTPQGIADTDDGALKGTAKFGIADPDPEAAGGATLLNAGGSGGDRHLGLGQQGRAGKGQGQQQQDQDRPGPWPSPSGTSGFSARWLWQRGLDGLRCRQRVKKRFHLI